MKNYTAKIALIGLIAAGLAVPALLSARAQDAGTNATDAATATAPVTPHKHQHVGTRFRGTVDNLDTNAMTLTVGDLTFNISAKTKITSNGEPATLADGVVGEKVVGFYRTNEDGSLHATVVHFGAHKKKVDSDASTPTSTNAPAN